ncbi:MAG: PKD domain-containing protein [Bacteroidales bacterium]|nr:PKD domain-containing protein [Bacteroidales bacterium]
MANTQGFEIVAEVGVSVLLEMLKAAWDNGGTDAEGAIPHEVEIATGTAIGPYHVQAGQVTLPKEGLSLVMAPAVNGVTAGFDTQIQVDMDQNALPVPSLSHFDMTAAVGITASFGIVPGTTINVGVIFEGLARSSVTVSLTSGDPIGAITLQMIREYVHNLYVDGTIPHSVTREGVSYGIFTFDAYLETYDDENDTAMEISVTQPDTDHIRVTIPVYLRLNHFNNPLVLSPLGIRADAIITAPFQYTSGEVLSSLSSGSVTVENIQPASGVEGTNYTADKAGAAVLGMDLDALISARVSAEITTVMNAIGEIRVTVPTVAQIETLIGDHVYQDLLSRRYFGTWTPETPEGTSVTIEEVRPKALADALAIAINPQNGADENALANFIPAGQAFAVAMDDEYVEQLIGEIVDRPRDDGGFGGIPTTFPNIEGHECTVNHLHWNCQSGAIHFWGDVTVVDAICKTDVTVDFWADIGLRWTSPGADGGQTLEPYVIDKDADLPWWAWLLAILTFLFEIILGIIAIVLVAVAEKIAERVGGAVMEDEVSGQLQSIGAWPQQLQGIGTVQSTFQEEVGIASDGLVFSGSILITAMYQMTMVSPANAGGPYTCQSLQTIHLDAGPAHPSLNFQWRLGDGSSASGHAADHKYIDNGLYVVRVRVKVTEQGGATTHHSVVMKVKNVRPSVDAGPDIEIDEGQVVDLYGTFSDPEWVDTHEATWNFGDDSLPQKGVLTETNDPPLSSGVITGSHAWCNNGEYRVTLQVRDKDGGVKEDSLIAKVRNVTPKVDAGDIFFAYPCTPVTLVARFKDPGWCDTHKAFWTFGDCTPRVPATVKEKHEPPEGFGIAAATHVYHTCGTFLAECEVIDSDGASGTDTLLVQVVDVLNKTFEEGFRNLVQGVVANEWEPYPIPGTGVVPGITALPDQLAGIKFLPAEFILHSGQRSQQILLERTGAAGIWQQVGTNPGWDYQVSAWYHLNENFGGKCRLGIDPKGGKDPSSADILWTEGQMKHEWDQLAGRITAQGNILTIFLEVRSDKEPAHAWFDDVRILPYPCPLEEPVREEEEPEGPKSRCVNWKEEKKERNVGPKYEKDGFSFSSIDKTDLRIVLWGKPEGTGKLSVPPKGLSVALPFTARIVTATMIRYHSDRHFMEAYDRDGNLLGTVSSSLQGESELLKLEMEGIAGLVFRGGGNETLLIELCIATGSTITGRPEGFTGKKYSGIVNIAARKRGCR